MPTSIVGATPGVDAATDDESDELPAAEDLLDDAPSGPDFEIDAAASSYYGPAPNTVSFRAKALNGSPPFTFTWDFGDGSEKASGERAEHKYENVGTFNAFVIGEDANKEHSEVQLILVLVTPERFVETMNLDPKLLDKLHSPGPSPAPAATPAQGNAGAS